MLPPAPQSARHALSTSDSYSTAILGDGPTAYYRLDDTNNVASDLSGHGLNGTVGTSVTESVAGLLSSSTDTAMSFPGQSFNYDLVKVPQNSALQPSNQLSYEAWVKFPAVPGNYVVAFSYGTDASSAPYMLWFNSGHMLAKFTLNTGVLELTTPSAVVANTTYYVAATYDGSVGRLYINGTQVASGSMTGTIANYSTVGLAIGDDAGQTEGPFKGTVDELAIYSGKALTAAQIGNHYTAGTQAGGATPTPTPTATPTATPTPSGSGASYASVVLGDAPTAYYRLDDTSSTVLDSSPNKLNGTAGTSVTKSVAGLLATTNDTAMSFPGLASTAGIVSVPNTSLLRPSNTVSFEAWIRFATVPSTYSVPLAYGSDSWSAPYMFWFTNGKIAAQFTLNNGALQVYSPSALSPNTTYYVAATYDGSVGRLYVNGTQVASASQIGTFTGYTTDGFAIGDDAGRSDPPFKGVVDEVALYSGKALTATQIANHYNAGANGNVSTPTPSPAPSYSDWPTFGDGLSRTQFNGSETTLSTSTVPNLKLVWKDNLGSAITAQPVIATNVTILGVPHNVAYVGTEGGVFYALDATTGAQLWSTQLNTVSASCQDLPGGKFGLTDTATFDRSTGRIYVADAHDLVHALDMTTGAEIAGWPVNIENQFNNNHVYSGLALSGGLLYVTTGSYCDYNTWQGRIDAINTTSATIQYSFFPAVSPTSGDGIWGLGGPAIDGAGNVFVATGNTVGAADNAPYGDALVQLTSSLSFVAGDSPGSASADNDFGASPMTYQPAGCPELVSAKRKDGNVFTWNASSIATPLQGLTIGNPTEAGQFVGAAAYSPISNLVYVGVPAGTTSNGVTYTHGIVALQVQTNCTLALAWQQTDGATITNTQNDNHSVTVANGVVYLADGDGKSVKAYDANTGTLLWSSGTTITGQTMVSPTVDGRLYVSSWDGYLYSFGL